MLPSTLSVTFVVIPVITASNRGKRYGRTVAVDEGKASALRRAPCTPNHHGVGVNEVRSMNDWPADPNGISRLTRTGNPRFTGI